MEHKKKNIRNYAPPGIARISIITGTGDDPLIRIIDTNITFDNIFNNATGSSPVQQLLRQLPGIAVSDIHNLWADNSFAAENRHPYKKQRTIKWYDQKNERYYLIHVYPQPDQSVGSDNADQVASSRAGDDEVSANSSSKKKNYTLLYTDTTANEGYSGTHNEVERLYESLQKRCDSVVAMERTRISAEIHDRIGQNLTALKLGLGWLSDNLENRVGFLDKIEKMMKLADQTLRITQEIAAGLSGVIYEGDALVPAIDDYCRSFQEQSGIRCLFTTTVNQGVNNRSANALLRILKEALTNVARHSGATRVLVELVQNKQTLEMIISDNGHGIPADKVNDTKSLGIKGMKKNAAESNGTIFFSGNDQGGSKITIFVPL